MKFVAEMWMMWVAVRLMFLETVWAISSALCITDMKVDDSKL